MKKNNDLLEIEKEVEQLKVSMRNQEKVIELDNIAFEKSITISKNRITLMYYRLLEYKNNIALKVKTNVFLKETYLGGKEIIFSIGTKNRLFRGAAFEFAINCFNAENEFILEQRSNSYTKGVDKHISFEKLTLDNHQLIKQLNYFCSMEINNPSNYICPYWLFDLMRTIRVTLGLIVYLFLFIGLVSFWGAWGAILGIIIGLGILGSLKN